MPSQEEDPFFAAIGNFGRWQVKIGLMNAFSSALLIWQVGGSHLATRRLSSGRIVPFLYPRQGQAGMVYQ